ncbi:MAG: cytochrome ubiquinol oxidase subunit I [Actinomycetales bacterium]|jgi:cytochrome bd ubiquinol oxidase subunit I|nr:cytochrome ubiquinol oxidase subunit I [Actinomycetales bacterium]
MDVLDLSRWQFGITTVYHFFFVPITLGLVWFVAAFQTIWYVSGQEKYLKLTKFFGKLFLINFALGVVTGIVQEFQFGMNWSDYSRFVGDVFGAPLAMEGLLAFFLESTFLGLWIFGWGRLPKKVHLATIWAAAVGTMLSAYFILAANAWMQHPVGFEIDPATGRAVLNDIGAVLFQNTSVIAFFHTMSASFLVAGTGVAAVGAWFLIKGRQVDIFRPTIKAGAIVTLIAAAAVSITGDMDSKIMVEQQPMKMAAAEALYETTDRAPFSVLTLGDVSGENATPILEVPGLLSFLSTGSFDGTVEGIDDIQAQYEADFGPGNYVPYVPVTYWGFRLMIGLGMLGAAWALWALWRYRGGRNPQKGRVFGISTLFVMLGPLLGISAGWIFTEMGRQPWVVFGEQLTANGVSTSISVAEVWISLIGFTLVYGILAVIEVKLLLKYIRAGAPETVIEDPYEDSKSNDKLYFAY